MDHLKIHRTPNRRSFKLIGGVTYKCKVCGHIAEREWCGAKRAIEYNKSTSILTVWHQGKHSCILKCQSESKEEKEAKKDLLKTVLKIFPRLSNAKLIDVGSQYYIQRGYPEVAKEFVQACTDKDIVSESRRESYNELLGFDQHSVHAVSIVKNKWTQLIHSTYTRSMTASGMVMVHMSSKVPKQLQKLRC